MQTKDTLQTIEPTVSHYNSDICMHVRRTNENNTVHSQLTLHVLDALSLLAGLANDLDGLTGKRAQLQITGHHKLHQYLDLLALLIGIVDIQLLRDTLASNNGRNSVVLSSRPIDHSLLASSFTTDRDHHLGRDRNRGVIRQGCRPPVATQKHRRWGRA